MGIYLGGGELGMAHEVPDRVEIDSGHGQVAGKGVAEIMQAAGEPGPGGRVVEVVANAVGGPGEQPADLGEGLQDRLQGRGD